VEAAKTHNVIGTYRRPPRRRERCAIETGCEIFQCDWRAARTARRLSASRGERFASLDLLVTMRGWAPRERRDILEATRGEFDEVMAANLKGPYF